MILYRPVGTKELDLIRESGWTRYPPRLPDQPIFYPVLEEEYACQIARDWNAKYNDDRRGYVTRFEVEDGFVRRYEVHTVGAARHRELWVPAEEQEEFQGHFLGKIEVIGECSGDRAEEEQR